MRSEFNKGQKQNRWKGLFVTVGIALLIMIVEIGGSYFLKDAADALIAIVLSFGAAALFYLVAEELLVEAIQAEESLFSTAMLFADFLVLLGLTLFGVP